MELECIIVIKEQMFVKREEDPNERSELLLGVLERLNQIERKLDLVLDKLTARWYSDSVVEFSTHLADRPCLPFCAVVGVVCPVANGDRSTTNGAPEH